jgi:hypothetical protein
MVEALKRKQVLENILENVLENKKKTLERNSMFVLFLLLHYSVPDTYITTLVLPRGELR